MLFENCDVDPRSGNVLTSPEFTLQSDQELTFVMIYPTYGNDQSLTVYRTSVTTHPTTMLGKYDPPENNSDPYSTNGTNSSVSTYRDASYTICLPAGTYQLVFIAAETGVVQSQIAVQEVSLTDESCTYTPPSGNEIIDITEVSAVNAVEKLTVLKG